MNKKTAKKKMKKKGRDGTIYISKVEERKRKRENERQREK